jgi:cobyrinic acid a,c-diamide synthase
MMGKEGIKDIYIQWTADADVVVIEDMDTLYNGANGGNSGSVADISEILGIPVVIIIDVWGMTRTTAVIMSGMESFDSTLQISGFILNRLGSSHPHDLIEHAIGKTQYQKVVATIEANSIFGVPERHLGLLTTHENPSSSDISEIYNISKQIDIE